MTCEIWNDNKEEIVLVSEMLDKYLGSNKEHDIDNLLSSLRSKKSHLVVCKDRAKVVALTYIEEHSSKVAKLKYGVVIDGYR